MKKLNLIMVTENNNNKFYNMEERDDGTFIAFWGRVGVTKSETIYPMAKWQTQYKSKLKKGYKDVSSLKTESSPSTTFKDIVNTKVKKLFTSLINYSNRSVIENYTVTSESVTQLQVDTAQEIIDRLANNITSKKRKLQPHIEVNEDLKELYMTIPRKMKKVQDHLLESDYTKKLLQKIVEQEQSTLDVMSQQVSMNTVKDENKDVSILDALGIEVEEVTDFDIEKIKELMGSDSGMFKKAYRVKDVSKEKHYDSQKSKSFKHWNRMLWHGSRNENWLNILKTGLMIRPAGSILTGAMFGAGIYLADKFKKSLGYSSLNGSYWSSGNSSTGYLALYEVNTGMEYRTQKHESWMYTLNDKKLKDLGDFDSVFAKGGVDLRNNEYIIYNPNQLTIRFLVEV